MILPVICQIGVCGLSGTVGKLSVGICLGQMLQHSRPWAWIDYLYRFKTWSPEEKHAYVSGDTLLVC